MWDNEDNDIIAEVKEAVEKQKNKPKEEVGKDDEGRSPEQYKVPCLRRYASSCGLLNRAISALPSILQLVIQSMAEVTGWVFFVSAGGPTQAMMVISTWKSKS